MANSIVEPSTGVSFDKELTLWDGKKLVNLGAGVRVIKFAFVPVKVYAIAVYADPEAIQAGGYDALKKPETQKVVLFELVRAITTKDFVGSLRKQLLPRMVGEEKSIDELETALGDQPLAKGSRTIIISREDGVILGEASIEGKVAAYPNPSAYSRSSRLAFNLFDIYTGEDSIAPTGREQWVKTANELQAVAA